MVASKLLDLSDDNLLEIYCYKQSKEMPFIISNLTHQATVKVLNRCQKILLSHWNNKKRAIIDGIVRMVSFKINEYNYVIILCILVHFLVSLTEASG